MMSVESNSQSNRNARELFTNVQYLKGLGPQRAKLLNKLGIQTVADLLFFFPRKYQDFTSLASADNLQLDTDLSILGEVVDVDSNYSRSGKLIVSVLVQLLEPQSSDEVADPTDVPQKTFIRATWFNLKYLSNKFSIGQNILLQGKLKQDENRFEMVHPTPTWLTGEELPERGQLLPVYQLTQGLSQNRIRQAARATVEGYAKYLEDVFPAAFLDQYALVGIQTAVESIHNPETHQALEAARKRLIFQELFVQQAALAMRKNYLRASQSAPELPLSPVVRSRILNRFPFELTESQLQVIDEIASDMGRNVPMNRLLHGEVGSGKTAVAAFAILLAVAQGHQALLMAPTEILVEQHIENLNQWLKGSRVEIASWTGSLNDRQRSVTRQHIKSGKTGIVVGTNALAKSNLEFDNLGVVVIDEQHKFGVKQRAQVRSDAGDPHYLVMTATPIPRTISMTLYGDLDVSTLQADAQMAREVHSYLGTEATRKQWWDFFRKKIDEGRQGYVIAPLVDSGDEEKTASVESLFESLTNGPLEAYRVDLLHGRQKPKQKLQIMHAFARGHTQVLVATSVVEVGVDVPNATVMSIESAEHFGLSQLHQLRGRIGRGAHPGFVCVFPSPEVLLDDPDNNSLKRLEAFVDSQNGFELAEIDLQIRGPGDFFSAKQHGFPPLRIADLQRDFDLLMEIREAARNFISQDPNLSASDYQRLRRMIIARYGKSLELSDVG